MPDSYLPPGWGPAPFDERDLDALLSGELTDIPVALRQVAEALTALRAGPTFAELSGEATIMAEFRAVAEFRVYAGLRDFGLSEARPGGLGPTRELPVLPSAIGARHVARHRAPRRSRDRARNGDRRAARLLTRPAVALTGAAAAAVIVAAVAFAGGLPGTAHRPSPSSGATLARTHPAAPGSASPGLAARGATPEPTPSPAPSATVAPGQSDAGRLCAAFFGFSGQQGRAGWVAEFSLGWQLSKLAGGAPRVYDFCKPYIGSLFPHGIPRISPNVPGWHLGVSWNPGENSQEQGNRGQGSPGQGSKGHGDPGPA